MVALPRPAQRLKTPSMSFSPTVLGRVWTQLAPPDAGLTWVSLVVWAEDNRGWGHLEAQLGGQLGQLVCLPLSFQGLFTWSPQKGWLMSSVEAQGH